MPHIIIAIDGPAASGKGTLARKLAAHLGYAYLDTGALYRAVGKIVLDAGKNPDDEQDAGDAARILAATLKPEDLQNPSLRTDEVGQAASKVARFPAVREALLQYQKDFAHNPPAGFRGVVLDGRDTGTVICPDADVKIFVSANLEERSTRRFKELKAKGIETTMEAVMADMKARDERDMSRDIAPLNPVLYENFIETTFLSEESALRAALEAIDETLVKNAARK